MAWWDRFFGKTHLAKVLFQLYTKDATRGAEVRARDDGKYYFVPASDRGKDESNALAPPLLD
jgi:hypothetical protein